MLRSLFSRPATVSTRTTVKNIDSRQLKERLDSDEPLILVDVRSPGEFQVEGHIPGARLLPLNALAGRIHELPRDRPIICVCRSGNRSRVACEMLMQAGFEDVVNLHHGMIGWQMSRFETH